MIPARRAEDCPPSPPRLRPYSVRQVWVCPLRVRVGRFRAPLKRGIMRHTISVLVENKFGVLTRVAGLFSGRGYNIDSLNVAPTQDPTTSRMTIVTRGDDATVDQIVKQLNKLVNVMHVHDFREGEYVDRELVLAKVAVDSKTRAEVMQITDIFRAKIVDGQALGPVSYTHLTL